MALSAYTTTMGSEERAASRMAEGAALLRAIHELYDDSPKVLSDPIISMLLDEPLLRWAQANFEWRRHPRTAGLRSHVVLRSRYAEDCLREAVSGGVCQYVILGAGFDTFAYRQPSWVSTVRIFEVDHPASQRAKLERLRSAAIPMPPNLEFVPADFESPSFVESLSVSSLDFQAPAFFSCLGVLVYLPQHSAKAVFQLVASFPKPSEIVFTFSQGERSSDGKSDGPALAKEAAAVGEPWRTYHDPDSLLRELREAGFSRVSLLSPDEARDRYFRERHDRLPPPRRTSIGRALV